MKKAKSHNQGEQSGKKQQKGSKLRGKETLIYSLILTVD